MKSEPRIEHLEAFLKSLKWFEVNHVRLSHWCQHHYPPPMVPLSDFVFVPCQLGRGPRCPGQRGKREEVQVKEGAGERSQE